MMQQIKGLPECTANARKPRVPVVFGGRSSEHGISVLPVDPADREVVCSEPSSVPKALGEVDVVFPVLHGPYGEDGTLQGLLELSGVPYMGSGVLASAVGQDKEYMKRVFTSFGLKVGPYVVIRPREWDRDERAARKKIVVFAGKHGWPLFVKPARGGSSVGISTSPAWTRPSPRPGAATHRPLTHPKQTSHGRDRGRVPDRPHRPVNSLVGGGLAGEIPAVLLWNQDLHVLPSLLGAGGTAAPLRGGRLNVAGAVCAAALVFTMRVLALRQSRRTPRSARWRQRGETLTPKFSRHRHAPY